MFSKRTLLSVSLVAFFLFSPQKSIADDCSDFNNTTFQQVSQYCAAINCETSGSTCLNVYIGVNPAMPGILWFTSDHKKCDENGEYWTGYWTTYEPCSQQKGMSLAKVEMPHFPYPRMQCGSQVRVEEQVLGEEIPIVGTPFSLRYSTQFVKGKASNYEGQIVLSGDTLEADINSFNVEVMPDGLPVTNHTYLNDMVNRKVSISWDGRNSSGLEVQGYKKFRVRVVEHRSLFDVPIESQVYLGGFRSKLLGLGGWAPSILKFYDIHGKRLVEMSGKIRNVEAAPFATGQVYVASEDGTHVYIFEDSTGRHLYTKTGITGSNVYTFNYDSAGRLISIVEPFNRTTTFNRDISGDLTSIVSPYGISTLITLDANGYISAVTNSDNEAFSMTYAGSDGLLQSFEKPSGHVSTFFYDAKGNLLKDEHSGGYFFDLVKSLNQNTVTVASTSPMLRTVTSTSTIAANGGYSRSVSYPNNLTEEFSYFPDPSSGITQINSTEHGVSSYLELLPDGRLGGTSFYPQNNTYTTSAGNRIVTSSQSVSLSNSNDPFSIVSWSFTHQLSGKNTQLVTIYDPTSKIFTSTTYLGKTIKRQIDSLERLLMVQQGNLNQLNFSYTN